ncbi:cytokine receptor [Bactrocera neohumeralis]|uniref:cytokine receptor n=1 Tax=Bactrocera neohumeralis TaxID=98809 RepID=UPI002166A830|nr:cytokine receptor [Bactrocera neohumeralis]
MSELLRYVSIATIVLCLANLANAFPDVGETRPPHADVNVGGSVNISCLINPNRFDDPCKLTFINQLTGQHVPEKDILVVNSSYIVYMFHSEREQSLRLLCKCDGDAIDESTIYVGTPPRGVRQFNCRSFDFEYMVCNFTQPENAVLTQYNLTYYINSPDYETPAYCNFDMKPLVVCNITAEYSYRPQVEEYHFKVHSINALGSYKQEFTINNLNLMVPARPGQDFHIIKLTTDSMDAIWSMPKYDSYTPNKHRGLQWEVLLQPDSFAIENISSQVRVVRVDRGCKLSITELPYAHYSYELRLRVKVRTAVAGEDMWSQTFKCRFRTKPRMPDRPPRTDNGGFYINPLETEVRLYWEQLEKWEENGDNFTYIIRALEKRVNDQTRALLPRQQEANFAIFEWHNDLHYTFEISSRNHMGESSTANVITIYPQTSRLAKHHTPHSIHNVYHETNRSYTLTWLPPQAQEGLQNYTVYWCYSKLAMPTDCRGSIHFQQVSSKTQRFATEPQSAEHDHSLTLAVSANYIDYNTGMHWTSCSVDVNADFEPMEPEILSISATELRVQWSSKTVCPSILSGYNLTYCEVANTPDTDSITPPSVESGLFEPFSSAKTVPAERTACVSDPTIITIDKNWNKFNITGLKPFTLYRLEMFMFSNVKAGKPNDQLLVRTFEAAPSPPRQLQVTELTNTSAKITWLAPSEANGYIRQYIVKRNNKEFVVNASRLDYADKISFVLENLTSFTSYKVFVIAVTRYKSNHSNDIHFTTYMSAPSKMAYSGTTSMNSKEVKVQWLRPSQPGGRVDYYEVAVTVLRGDYVERRRIAVVFGNSCVLRVPACPDPDYQTNVEVRAINAGLIKNNEVNPKDVIAHQTEFDPDANNYEYNDEFACVGTDNAADVEREKAALVQYHKKDNYLLYKSDWYPLTSFGCSQRQLGKITVITLMIVCTSLMLMALMFFATKKWKMMSDIQCTLPAALVDAYLTKERNGGGCGGGGYNSNIVNGSGVDVVNDFIATPTSRNINTQPLRDSNERLHIEEHHLLSRQQNDLGYMSGGLHFGRSISALAETQTSENESGEEDLAYHKRDYLNSESSADSLIDSTSSSSGANSELGAQDAVPLQRIAEEPTGYVQAAQVQTGGVLGGYVMADNLQAWMQPKAPVPADATVTAQPSAHGYVQANALIAAATENNTAPPNTAFSGYIRPTALPQWPTQSTPTTTAAAQIANESVGHGGYIKPTALNTPSAWDQPPQIGASGIEAGTNSNYINASDLRAAPETWTEQKQQPKATAANNNGYITVDSLEAHKPKTMGATTTLPPAISVNTNTSADDKAPTLGAAAGSQSNSAYVQPSTLQALLFNTPTTTGARDPHSPLNNANITNFSGYTTLDALGKLTPTQGAPTAHRPEQADLKPRLMGYVTQREMNEFGQQHMH